MLRLRNALDEYDERAVAFRSSSSNRTWIGVGGRARRVNAFDEVPFEPKQCYFSRPGLRIARLSLRSSARPRVALERDGALYDVEALERELGAAVEIPGDAWDFHARVVALSGAGLAELDHALLQGRRPTAARIFAPGFAWLPPFDSDRASYVHAVCAPGAAPTVRVGHAPSALGQDALVDLGERETRPDFGVSLGVVIGDDLANATVTEVKNAVAGVSLLVDWFGRGLRPQLGPVLVPARLLGNLRSVSVTCTVRDQKLELGSFAELGISVEEAIAAISRELPIRAGDLVGVGPLPRGSCAAHGVSLALHDKVVIATEKIGELRGTPVPRR